MASPRQIDRAWDNTRPTHASGGSHGSRIAALVLALLWVSLASQVALAARTVTGVTIVGGGTTFYTGEVFQVQVTVSTSGVATHDDWRSTSYSFDNATWVCADTSDYTEDGTYTETLAVIAGAPLSAPPQTLYVRAHADDGCAEGDSLAYAIPVTLQTHANPDLAAACGLDIILVLDESWSIAQTSGATAAVRSAANTFLTSLNNTGSSVAIVEFSTQARTVFDFTQVNDANLVALQNYVNDGSGAPQDGYDPAAVNGATNWDDAFDKVEALNTTNRAPLVVFLTDGDPTVYGDGAAYNSSTFYAPTDPRLVQAVAGAGAVKVQGSHILAVGVGAGLISSGSQNRLKLLAGSDVYAGSGSLDLTTTDLVLESDFAELGGVLRQIVTALCRSSVTLTKLVDPGTGVYAPATGWVFTASASYPAPNGAGFTWSQPAVAAGGAEVSGATQADGILTFQWRPEGTVGTSAVVITETPQTGYRLVSPVACQKRVADGSLTQFEVTPSGTTFTITGIETNASVTCQVKNQLVPVLSIAVEKAVSGDDGASWSDADGAPGPSLPAGTDPRFRIVVTNNSNVALSSLHLSDSILSLGACTVPSVLDAGASYTCIITAPWTPGQHTSTTTATGTHGGSTVSATDTANYFGIAAPDITVTMTANPAALPEPGGNVTFSILVENHSASAVNLTALTDTVYGDLNGQGTCSVPQPLAAADGSAGTGPDTYTCSFSASVTGNAGDSQADTVTATASNAAGSDSDDDSATVTLTDVPSSILVTVKANPSIVLEPGGDVTFTVTITNTSAVDSVTLNTVEDSVTGDVAGGCSPGLPVVLAPGATLTCTFTRFVSGTTGAPHTSVVTVRGGDDDGNPVQDDDAETVVFLPRVGVGDYVWEDTDEDGIQDPGETGVPTVTVVLLDSAGTVIMTTTTDSRGRYLFGNLVPGAYRLRVVKPTDFDFTKQAAGDDPTRDSDVNAVGETDLFVLTDGNPDLTRDAGLVDTSPTGADEEDQPPAPPTLYLPALQGS